MNKEAEHIRELETATSAGLPLYPRPIPRLIRWLSLLWLIPQREIMRRRLGRTVIERVAGHEIVVLPDVFNPSIFRTGKYLADYICRATVLDELCPGTDSVRVGRPRALDVGTGSGILAICAAARGFHTIAVDVSADAARCARINAARNGFDALIDVREGDLFTPVQGEQFDLVLCSLPKFRGSPESRFEIGWRSEDVIERFAHGLPEVLAERGLGLVLLTTHGDDRGMIEALLRAGLSVEPLERRHFGIEIFTIYGVRHQDRRTSNSKATTKEG